MSTAAVSSSSIYQELQGFYQSRQADLQQLGSDLQSGNLNNAQQDYNALVALGQSGPFASSDPFAKSSKDQAFTSIGQALQSGDLAGAQAAFATLTGKAIPVTAATPVAAAAVVNLSNQASGTSPTNSGSSIYQQLQAYRQQKQADIAQLGQDLQSGNLSAAQQDYSTLVALGQSGPNKNGQTFQRTDRSTDFAAIGKALQNGDLSGAQSAFASLESTYGGQNQQAQSAISAYTSNPTEIVINLGSAAASNGSSNGSGTSATPEVVINIDPGSSSASAPEQIQISLGSASSTGATNGSATPELVINLGQGSGSSSASSPEEIQINLGAASSTSAANSSTTPELIINLGQGSSSSPASSSPEEITINLGSDGSATQTSGSNQGSVSAGNPLTINLGSQNNYELILNLLNSGATTSSGNGLSVSA
ncbi:MAG: hypothetical protein ABSD75_24090 [Terriglobales bacterium]|jgi:hypothetical protein